MTSYGINGPHFRRCSWPIRNCTTCAEEEKFKDCESHLLARYPELSLPEVCRKCKRYWRKKESGIGVGELECYITDQEYECRGKPCEKRSEAYLRLYEKLGGDLKCYTIDG